MGRPKVANSPYPRDASGKPNPNAKPVVVDGIAYPSGTVAARFMGVNYKTLRSALQAGMERYGGHSIRYAAMPGRDGCRTAQI